MKKLFLIILCILVTLLFLTGCDNKKKIEDKVDEITDVLDACPDCEECPSPDECPTCDDCICQDCAECEVCGDTGNLMELEFEDVELLELDDSGSKESRNFYYNGAEYDTLNNAHLVFKPRCDNDVEAMRIEVNDDKVFDGEINCGVINDIDLDIAYVDAGRNSLTLISSGEYMVTNIVLHSEFDGLDPQEEVVFDVQFEIDDDEIEFKSLSDFTLKNYYEYEINLDEDDIEKDLILAFDAPDNNDGDVRVLFNDEEIYYGIAKKRNNRISIPKVDLSKGENYLTIIGIPK
ncbi:MAG: hypothetical protein KKG59_03795 [Nanoarchaeota archaeon]|nr:hypothetical protein [Nanoarchaeota archaeon]